MRKEEMHAQLLDMGICPVLSKQAALEIGVGSLNLAIDFCLNEQTRERVRKEAQKVVQKTGLRSQRAEAASLRGLSAPAPADLVGNAATPVVASTASADSHAEESADEESAPLSARAEAARLAVGKRGAAEDEEMRRDGALPRPCMHCPRHYMHHAALRTRHRRPVLHVCRVRRVLRGRGRCGVGAGRPGRGCSAQHPKEAKAHGGGREWGS